MITAYTHPYGEIKDRILIDCSISLPGSDTDSSKSVKALWDTGATTTCISVSLAKQLGLEAVDNKYAVGANNEPFEVPMFCVQIKMGSFLIPIHNVLGLPMEGTDRDVIIGMDIISKGDLAITNFQGRTILSFRTPSLESVDYVQELSIQKKCNTIHRLNISKNLPDKCACGSGKEYKNCHGKSVYAKNKA